MTRKIATFATLLSLVFWSAAPALALEATVPPPETPTVEEPAATEPVTEPVTEVLPPADTTAPNISEVAAISLGLNEVTIAWTTDELAVSRLSYGTTASLGQQATLAASALLVHSAVITGFLPNTTYHYCIYATDATNNTGESCGHTFTTEAEPVPVDTMSPVVSEVTVSNMTTSSVTLSWTTDEVANGYVEYGTTPDYGSQTPLSADFAEHHSVTISGLAAGTTYHYRIVANDAALNTFETPDENFTTEATPVVEPPVEEEPVSTSTPVTEPTATSTPSTGGTATTTEPVPTLVFASVEANHIASTSVTIHWETSIPADSLVEYGVTPQLGSASTHSTEFATAHEALLTGLTPDTLYYFRVVSKPSGATVASVSDLHEFTTLEVPIVIDPAADITSVATSTVSSSGVTISWTTNEPTHGGIEYGTSTAYGMELIVATSSNSHTASLSGLTPDMTYHFRVKAVDAGGNETYSLDHKIHTSPSLSGGSGGGTVVIEAPTSSTPIATSTPPIEETATTTPSVEPTPASEPTPAPAPVVHVPASGGGGGGVFVQSPGTPLLVTAAPADSEVMFSWQNPGTAGLAGVKLVKKDGAYPTSPSDGTVIYAGNAETFTDTDLENGQTHYYALFAHNVFGEHSKGVPVSVAPQAGVDDVKVEKVPVLVPDMPIEHFTETHAFGDRAEEVIHLQQILNIEGVHESGLTTGYFGPLTKASLLKFQEKHDLPQTGITDPVTRTKLNTISLGHVDMSLPGTIAILEDDLSRGAQGELVGHLQGFLAYEGSYPEALITSYFGSLTQAAVARFQKKYGVTPAVGYVGPKTRHQIQTVLGL